MHSYDMDDCTSSFFVMPPSQLPLLWVKFSLLPPLPRLWLLKLTFLILFQTLDRRAFLLPLLSLRVVLWLCWAVRL